jgi:hypothetical protein
LAGESAANNVNCFKFVSSDISYVSKPSRIRAVVCQDCVALAINLNLPGQLQASAFKPQIETAYASE